MTGNLLYYGDNLTVLRDQIKDESVDLVYLDPPFNSQANYNVLFKAPSGAESHAQVEAFEDTWHWGEPAERAFDEVMKGGNTAASELLRSLRAFLHENDMMAYLAMMAIRLLELHRVLKETGSLYLHCDPAASHYLKILLDGIFSPQCYRNEIIWERSKNPKGSQYKTLRWGPSTDTILFYARSDRTILNVNAAKSLASSPEIARRYPHTDVKGRWADGPILRSDSMGQRDNLVFEYKGFTPGPAGWRMVKEELIKIDEAGDFYWTSEGRPRRRFRPSINAEMNPLSNCWTDIAPINSQAQERLGYPTQKPVALLERIIRASSRTEDDLILDPFCGCGTAIHAAQKLGRRWIGIDITHLAISLIEKRLTDAFPGIEYEVHGTPKDLEGARDLAARDKYQFQWWAGSLVGAIPFGGKKKGADSGIDGIIYFKDFKKDDEGAAIGTTTEKIIVSVKGGENVNVAMIRDLAHVVTREKAKLGLFITLAEPTDPMRKEALAEGYFETSRGGKFLKLQILTVADLLDGKKPDLPPADVSMFTKAPKEIKPQRKLL